MLYLSVSTADARMFKEYNLQAHYSVFFVYITLVIEQLYVFKLYTILLIRSTDY